MLIIEIIRHSYIRKKEIMTEEYIDLTGESKAPKRRRKKRRRRNNIIFGICLITCVMALTVDVILALMYKQEKEENALLSANNIELSEELNDAINEVNNTNNYTPEEIEAIKEESVKEHKNMVLSMFENGEPMLTILEKVYSDMIVVPDSGNYYFFEIIESLAKSTIDNSKLVYPVMNEETREYEGRISYSDDTVSIKHGVDVSKFQGDVDWDKVKNDGYEFTYIRAGFRGYEKGTLSEDEKFVDNIEGANAAGLDVGVYFFTEAITEAEGREEAEFVLELLEGHSINLPIVIDVEESANKARSRSRNLTPEERTAIVKAFCERIKEAGYTPMIYGNLKSHMRMTNIDELEEYDKWFAYYRFPLKFPYKFKVWQYSSTGRVDGINGDADLNIAVY